MMIECCSQERTWLPYYGLIAQRFCMLHRRWQGAFTECFETNYNTIHRCGISSVVREHCCLDCSMPHVHELQFLDELDNHLYPGTALLCTIK